MFRLFSVKPALAFLLSFWLLAGADAFAQRHKGNKYNKRNKNSFESRMNRKKTGMLNHRNQSRRTSNRYMGSNRVKKKNNQYKRSNYYTSRARGKKGRAGSFNYRARGTRHNSIRPFKSGKKKFKNTRTSPFKSRNKRDYSSSGNRGTKVKGKRKKTSRGLGNGYKYSGKQPGTKSSQNFTSRKNKRKARKKQDYQKGDKKFKYNKRGARKTRGRQKTRVRRHRDKPDFSYNKRKYEKNKRKNMRKSTRKRLNPRD